MKVHFKHLILFIAIISLPLSKSYAIFGLDEKAQAIKPMPYSKLVVVTHSTPSAAVYIGDTKITETDYKGYAKRSLPQYKNGAHELIIENDETSLSYNFILKKPSYLYCRGAEKLCCILSAEKIHKANVKDIECH